MSRVPSAQPLDPIDYSKKAINRNDRNVCFFISFCLSFYRPNKAVTVLSTTVNATLPAHTSTELHKPWQFYVVRVATAGLASIVTSSTNHAEIECYS